jgi:hypothetical protein
MSVRTGASQLRRKPARRCSIRPPHADWLERRVLLAASLLLPDMTGSPFRTGADVAASGDSVPVSFTVENRGVADSRDFQVQAAATAFRSP